MAGGGRLSPKTVAFFGGSTTWGTGARDAETIPSYFAKLNPEFATVNFGESGYMARQSLNLLMKRHIEGYRPDLVVFYDGVNDAGKCRYELGPFSHAREQEIRSVLREGSMRNTDSFGFLVLPMRKLSEKVGRMLTSQSGPLPAFHDCQDNQQKAELIARALLQDWLSAKQLVVGSGGQFLAVLQPVAYLSKTRLDQLSLDPGQGRQYEIVYPLILKLLREEPQFAPMQASFLDLRDALDQDAYLYIDWCHLSPNGNEIVAARISEAVARLVARRIGHRRTRAHDSEGGGLARRQPGGADAGRAVHQTAAVRS